MLAALLGMHESTVNRATASKCLQLPWPEVTESDCVLDASQPAKEITREAMGSGDPHAPFSDRAVARLRRQRDNAGIARRKVEKYRDELRIPLSGKWRKCE